VLVRGVRRMVDIIYGGMPGQTGGGESWIDKLLPIGVLLAAGYMMYRLIANPTGGTSATPSDNSGTPSTGVSDLSSLEAYLESLVSGRSSASQTGTAQQTGTPSTGSTSTDALSKQVSDLIAQLAKGGSAGATAAASKTASAINLAAGPTSPIGLFTHGAQIGYSDQPTVSQEEETARNLENSGITNAWWNATPTITPLPNAPLAGINSGGSPQSNISAGVKHCTCTAALKASGRCGANDDWYIC
jgi:hypothetical protein